jgi:hypothetical protein
VKRLIACASLVAAATTAAIATTPSKSTVSAAPKTPAAAAKTKPKTVAHAPAKCKVAPADEYFGKLKMSILGIRNTIKDQGLKVDYDPAKADSTLNAIALTEDAMHDWQRKYPCDTWIPGTIYSLEHFYLKIHTADGVKHVHAAYAWLRHDFPRHRLVQLALREDGQATVISPSMAAAPGNSDAGSSAAPVSAPGAASAQQQQIQPGGVTATPIPGTAPASVINAQNAMGATPAPTTAPH